MSSTKPSFSKFYSKALKKYDEIVLANEQDEESIHNILESIGMRLGKNLILKSSRRPDLSKSFLESNHETALFTDKDKNKLLAAMNKVPLVLEGKKTAAYYSSDLRLARSADKELRSAFQELYFDVIQEVEKDNLFFTIILKDNAKALKKLATSKTPFFYNKMFEYNSATVVVLPSIDLHLTRKLEGCKVEKASNHETALGKFLTAQQKKYVFSNDIKKSRASIKSEDEFVVMKDGKVQVYFSLFRPQYRSMLVESRSLLTTGAIEVAKTALGIKLKDNKLPWVYLSSFVVDPAFETKENLLEFVILYLRKQKRINIGELLLTIQQSNDFFQINQGLFLKCPAICKKGIVFQIETKDADRTLEGKVHLDPREL